MATTFIAGDTGAFICRPTHTPYGSLPFAALLSPAPHAHLAILASGATSGSISTSLGSGTYTITLTSGASCAISGLLIYIIQPRTTRTLTATLSALSGTPTLYSAGIILRQSDPGSMISSLILSNAPAGTLSDSTPGLWWRYYAELSFGLTGTPGNSIRLALAFS